MHETIGEPLTGLKTAMPELASDDVFPIVLVLIAVTLPGPVMTPPKSLRAFARWSVCFRI
jgi:hypothetical protein